MATCRELAEDKDSVMKVSKLYWELEKNATPTALLLPWLPSPSRRDKARATRELFDMLNRYVDVRRNADEPASDAFDVLISEGADNRSVVGVIHFFPQYLTTCRSLNVHFVVRHGRHLCWSR